MDSNGEPSLMTDLIQAWRKEEARPFTGWDFSYLEGKMLKDQPPWSYPDRAAELMATSTAMLDMGTGGGERLLALREFWPEKVVVTEAHPPNVELARERLGPLGVAVKEVALTRDGPMPFADCEFDLVLNRHSGLNSAEVGRILAPGGVFLTRQVHGLWAQDLLAEFGARPAWPDAAPSYYVPRLEAAGLEIVDEREWAGDLAFTGVGAIVYYLKAIPWLVPGFSVDRYRDILLRLQQQIKAGETLVYEARLYLIEAQKAKNP